MGINWIPIAYTIGVFICAVIAAGKTINKPIDFEDLVLGSLASLLVGLLWPLVAIALLIAAPSQIYYHLKRK